MCRVNITGGECPQEEINAYIARGQQLYGREPDAIDVRLDGEYVELAYHYQNQPFDRIRRITGYLVGHARPLQQRQARRGARPREAQHHAAITLFSAFLLASSGKMVYDSERLIPIKSEIERGISR